MMMETREVNLANFEKKIGITFRRSELLRQAFVHRSYLNENRDLGLDHNERLEFLGDAVLELAVTDHLYRQFPEETEGNLTGYRAALVNTVTLGRLGEELGFNDLLLLSRGEARDTGRGRQVILANTFESVVGAIYLDQGFDVARDFVARTVLPLTERVAAGRRWQDAKSFLQERAQEKLAITPAYRVLEASGPDHDKNFTIGVYFGEELVARGEGPSKQEAEQSAAAGALAARGWSRNL